MDTRYEEIKGRIVEESNRYERMKGQLDTVVEQIDTYNTKQVEYEETIALHEDVRQVYNKILSERTGEVREVLETVLNDALSRVPMDSRYRATLVGPDFTKANSTVEIVLVDLNTGQERKPLVGTGTMLAQLVSFLMTAIVIKFSGKRRIMVLDEVLSGFYDKEAIRTFGEILVSLAKNEGFQFIMVEHKSELEKVKGLNILHVHKESYQQGLTVLEDKIGGEEEDED